MGSALDEIELMLFKVALKAMPSVAQWLGDLIAGKAKEEDTRRISDILPERSASEEVLDELRGRETTRS